MQGGVTEPYEPIGESRKRKDMEWKWKKDKDK